MKNEIKEFKQKIEKLIKEQRNTYETCNKRIISDYGKEKSTTEDYNGRQLLELLQNADDAKSTEVLIKLNTEKSTLIIQNKGNECEPFSVEGIDSLMLANLSSKTNGQYIGSKGLGFRSIINWSDKISIESNNLKLSFSKDY